MEIYRCIKAHTYYKLILLLLFALIETQGDTLRCLS